jgi:hypothetical protein
MGFLARVRSQLLFAEAMHWFSLLVRTAPRTPLWTSGSRKLDADKLPSSLSCLVQGHAVTVPGSRKMRRYE